MLLAPWPAAASWRHPRVGGVSGRKAEVQPPAQLSSSSETLQSLVPVLSTCPGSEQRLSCSLLCFFSAPLSAPHTLRLPLQLRVSPSLKPNKQKKKKKKKEILLLLRCCFHPSRVRSGGCHMTGFSPRVIIWNHVDNSPNYGLKLCPVFFSSQQKTSHFFLLLCAQHNCATAVAHCNFCFTAPCSQKSNSSCAECLHNVAVSQTRTNCSRNNCPWRCVCVCVRYSWL